MAIKLFIIQKKIKSINIVNDTSIRFITEIINKKKLLGSASKKVIEDLFLVHYLSV